MEVNENKWKVFNGDSSANELLLYLEFIALDIVQTVAEFVYIMKLFIPFYSFGTYVFHLILLLCLSSVGMLQITCIDIFLCVPPKSIQNIGICMSL